MLRFLSLLALLPAIQGAPVETRQADDIIPNKWLVRVRPTANIQKVVEEAPSLLRLANTIDPTATYEIGSSYKGFAIDGSSSLADLLLSLEDVVDVEPDRIVRLVQGAQADNDTVTAASFFVGQQNAPFNLARLSTRPRGASTTYQFHINQGLGATTYILDTGVQIGHNDLKGNRASHGANFSPDGFVEDRNGHGTHVAGTVAGETWGVAKASTIVSVKVLGADGTGTLSGVLSGLQWARDDMNSKNIKGRAVANLSLGAAFSQQVNDMVDAAVQDGLIVVVAAGNSNQDASTQSPASAALACTVAAVDNNDVRASFSNFGPGVDLFAPGVDITSLWWETPDQLQVLSGTSMAAPHVAGLAAYFGGRSDVPFSPGAAMCDYLKSLATQGLVQDPNGSPNLLAYNNAQEEQAAGG